MSLKPSLTPRIEVVLVKKIFENNFLFTGDDSGKKIEEESILKFNNFLHQLNIKNPSLYHNFVGNQIFSKVLTNLKQENNKTYYHPVNFYTLLPKFKAMLTHNYFSKPYSEYPFYEFLSLIQNHELIHRNKSSAILDTLLHVLLDTSFPKDKNHSIQKYLQNLPSFINRACTLFIYDKKDLSYIKRTIYKEYPFVNPQKNPLQTSLDLLINNPEKLLTRITTNKTDSLLHLILDCIKKEDYNKENIDTYLRNLEHLSQFGIKQNCLEIVKSVFEKTQLKKDLSTQKQHPKLIL